MSLNKAKILNIEYVQSKMAKIAPNLSNLVGSMVILIFIDICPIDGR